MPALPICTVENTAPSKSCHILTWKDEAGLWEQALLVAICPQEKSTSVHPGPTWKWAPALGLCPEAGPTTSPCSSGPKGSLLTLRSSWSPRAHRIPAAPPPPCLPSLPSIQQCLMATTGC